MPVSYLKRNILRAVPLLAGAALWLPVAAASAASTASTSFQVSATVQATCLISAGNLSFSTYTGVQADASSTITVTCTNTTPYDVGLDAGTFSGASVTTRKMTGPDSNGLAYGLYRTSARSTNWGNSVGTDTVSGTGNGSAQNLTVYGRLPGGQYVKPGDYADTITATITY